MTTLQVHLLMLGLGLIAYLFLAGLFSNRKSHSKRLRRQWWLGALAGIVVALSPFSRLWREPATTIELLAQSLLVAAISLLALLLFALLRYPLRAIRNNRKNKDETETTQTGTALSGVTQVEKPLLANDSKPIVINADQAANATSNLSVSESGAPAEVTVDRSAQKFSNKSTIDQTESAEAFVAGNEVDISELSLAETTDSVDVSDISTEDIDAFTLEDDQENTLQLELTDIESVVSMKTERDSRFALNEQYRQSDAANDNNSIANAETADLASNKTFDTSSTSLDNDSLDLSETEELFAEIRQQKSTVDLPNEDELRQAKANATIDELDLDSQLVHDNNTQSGDSQKIKTADESIVEAEVVELDESSLEFGNDLTGEYSHPVAATPSVDNTADVHGSVPENSVPETLDDAILAAKATAVSLQAQVSNLEQSIDELDDLRDSTIDATIDAANFNAEQKEMQLKQKDALLRSEDEARAAAESVIAAQSALIDRAKRQQAVVNSMLQDERKRMSLLQVEVERSRKMARTAANLARKAAIAQQEIRDVAQREKLARLKSQESTRKAVSIARNAISALAAEERKRGLTRH